MASRHLRLRQDAQACSHRQLGPAGYLGQDAIALLDPPEAFTTVRLGVERELDTAVVAKLQPAALQQDRFTRGKANRILGDRREDQLAALGVEQVHPIGKRFDVVHIARD